VGEVENGNDLIKKFSSIYKNELNIYLRTLYSKKILYLYKFLKTPKILLNFNEH